MMWCQVEDVLAHIVYCGSCGECTGHIKCMWAGYDLIPNCCSNLYYVIIVYLKPDYILLFLFWLDVGRPAKSRYPEGPVTGHLVSGFLGFPGSLSKCWDGSRQFQVATTCFSCSPPYLNIKVKSS